MASPSQMFIVVLFLWMVVLCRSQLPDAGEGTFWHVTDFHYDHTYGTTGLSCNENVSMSGYYGDYWCDAPWTLVTDTVDNMAKIESNPDFILWTGDSVAHIKDPDLSLQINVEIVSNVTTIISAAFPDIPVYATLGNHDFWPSDHAEDHETEFYRKVAALWTPWIGDDTQVQLFKKGGYYAKDISTKLRVLCLNTNLYYTNNDLSAQWTDPADQFSWMREQLADVRAQKKKAILTGHIPPGILTPGLVDWFRPQFHKSMMDVVTSFSDVIVASHFGHDHMDGFKLLQKEDGTHSVPQFTAPSVTPWRYKIPSGTGAPHNPGMRLVRYDRSTTAHLDYDQYYVNLTDSNQRLSTKWTKLYRFTEAYDVPDMSLGSVRKILDRMSTLSNPYAVKYCQYSVVSSYPQTCTTGMQAEIYCGGVYDSVARAKKCKNDKLFSGVRSSLYGGSNVLFVGLAALMTFATPLVVW